MFGWLPAVLLNLTMGGSNTNAVVVPSANDVRLGIVFDANNLPSPNNVRNGVVYG